MVTAAIAGFGSAFPQTVEQTQLWEGFFANHFDNNAIAKRMFSAVGVTTRHAVVNPLIEDASSWSTQQRMQRYLPEAMPLAVDAVEQALNRANLDPRDVGQLIVASCTGYESPGVDVLVAQQLGMSASLQRLIVGHMGCFAAIPGLRAASDFVVANHKPAVLLCIELASLHVQPPTNDIEQIVAHSLFSDAAVAVVLLPDANGIEVIDVAAMTDLDHMESMTWRVTDQGFRMTLGQEIPDVLATQIRPMVEKMLLSHDLTIDDIDGWAIHPGGPRILDVAQERLKLEPTDLAHSRRVLAGHGNCSSATALLVLDELNKTARPQPGQHVITMAFGPGLTLYAALLRYS